MRLKTISTIVALVAFAAPASAKEAMTTVEADNGTRYEVEVFTRYQDGSAIVYISEENTTNVPALYAFDCRGHMQRADSPRPAPLSNVPPRSVAGRIQAIICKRP